GREAVVFSREVDSIRSATVTGVQTFARPICRGSVLDVDAIGWGDEGVVVSGIRIDALSQHHPRFCPGVAVGLRDYPSTDAAVGRSEERRVGKEGGGWTDAEP